MPYAPKSYCTSPGCKHFRPCPEHSKRPDSRSEQAKEWHALYGSRWQKARKAWLSIHPTCVDPYQTHGPLIPATVVDHIEPHRGDVEKFWDSSSNWQSLCGQCHSHKTATEDGGFGNAPASTLNTT